MNLASRYAFFAVISIFVNISFQELVVWVYFGPYQLYLSMAVGTLFGLITKYWLDKRYIFKYRPASTANDIYTFLIYSFTGVLTTMIFWGMEISFELIFKNKIMRYLGGVAGLTIGYCIKYKLDNKYVFVGNNQFKCSE